MTERTLVQRVTHEEIDQALASVEKGTSGVEDANLLRAYLRMLEGRIMVYELGEDDEARVDW